MIVETAFNLLEQIIYEEKERKKRKENHAMRAALSL